MGSLKLKVLSPHDYRFLETKDPRGSYDKETRETLYWIVEKLRVGGRRCSRLEKKLYKKFADANFGILIRRGTLTQGKIFHSGDVRVEGRFEGEIVARDTVIVEKPGIVLADVSAGAVVCRGKIQGNVQATDRVHLEDGAEVLGNLRTSRLQVEPGALLLGRCSMLKNDEEFAIFPRKKTPRFQGQV